MLTDGQIALAAKVLGLLAVGGLIGLLRPRLFSWRWLLVAAALVILNDATATRVWRLAPRVLPRSDFAWQGKLMALAASLVVASLPAFGRRRSGLTLRQTPGSLRPALVCVALYVIFLIGLALMLPNGQVTGEELAFQLTLPGLEEELFYRGVLLLAFDRAFAARARLLGVDWGWSAVLTSVLFGLDHAFGYSHGAFSFDALTMALTALPSLVAVWIRLRTGSLLLPVVMHNAGNVLALLV